MIRKKHHRREDDDSKSVATSYMLSSVLSATSKRSNIDDILKEQEVILERVQKIDD